MTPLQVVQSIYEAFTRGDIPYIVSRVSRTASWKQSKTLPWGGDYAGPDGVAEFFRKLAAEMTTTAFTVRENIEAGNEVFSFGYYEGRSHRTGRVAGSEWMFRWRVENDKIIRYDAYQDTAALLAGMEARAAAGR